MYTFYSEEDTKKSNRKKDPQNHIEQRNSGGERKQGISSLYHSVVLHVAGFANRLVFLHDVGLSSQHTVTVKTAEVLQVPIVALGLSVLITEDELETTHTHNCALKILKLFRF